MSDATSRGIDSPNLAIEAASAAVRRTSVDARPLLASLGLALAHDAVTDRPSPPFDASAMDGYAVNAAQLVAGKVRVAGEVRIGTDPGSLDDPRAAIRIVTGAAIPKGADAVIRREDVVEESDGGITISSSARVKCVPGLCVRRTGENAPAGTALGLAGREISAPVAAALATAGVTHPRVHSPVRVAILTTGDELVGFDESPGPWQLRDSNGPALAAMIGRRAWLTVTPPRRVHDDPAVALAMAKSLLESHDCLLLTGGVSMGHRDFVPAMIESLGATILCHKLPQRPGKPLLLAARDGSLIAALPGNPQSVMVTARRVVLPILARMAGLTEPAAGPQVALLGPTTDSLPLWWYRPATIDATGLATLVKGQGSGDIVAASRSDGFVELRPDQVIATPTLVPWYGWAW